MLQDCYNIDEGMGVSITICEAWDGGFLFFNILRISAAACFRYVSGVIYGKVTCCRKIV